MKYIKSLKSFKLNESRESMVEQIEDYYLPLIDSGFKLDESNTSYHITHDCHILVYQSTETFKRSDSDLISKKIGEIGVELKDTAMKIHNNCDDFSFHVYTSIKDEYSNSRLEKLTGDFGLDGSKDFRLIEKSKDKIFKESPYSWSINENTVYTIYVKFWVDTFKD